MAVVDFPDEIWEKILQNITDVQNMANVERVNRRFYGRTLEYCWKKNIHELWVNVTFYPIDPALQQRQSNILCTVNGQTFSALKSSKKAIEYILIRAKNYISTIKLKRSGWYANEED